MRSIKFTIVLAVALNLVQCLNRNEANYTIAYPEPRPDSISLQFLPGIVCTDSLDFNSAFSPDGKSFYFSHSSKGKFNIYVTSFDGKNWTKPSLTPFSEVEYSAADPFIMLDGTIYFISDRPRDESDTIRDFDIWFVSPQQDGKWSAPENLQAVNSDSTEYYVSLASNKNIYFASNREGGYGDHDIYLSKFVNGKYETPENLGASINSPEMDHDPFISSDEEFLIFTSVSRKDSFGEADLYYSERKGNQGWSLAKNLGKQINTPTYEYCSYISHDSKYFFYSSNYDVKWIDVRYLPFKIKANSK